MNERNRDLRIAIIGAGPAGLSTAHYLKARGYRRVTVFEKLGRVGGMCSTITVRNKPFDLGGNYITPAYRETRKLAKKVKARAIGARAYMGARIDGDRVVYHGISTLVRQDPNDPKKLVGLFALARAVVRFGLIRWKLRHLVDQPTLEWTAKKENQDLCVSFHAWLEQNDLLAMRRMFEIPVTTFGYGFLDEIPAPYVLRYMHPKTYLAMVLRGLPVIGRFAPWPKRFRLGFQNLWERVASELDVRLSVHIKRIVRDDSTGPPIVIDLERWEQRMNERVPRREVLSFDRLILACPLTLDVFQELGLEPSPAERQLFSKVTTHAYCQTLVNCVEKDDQRNDLLLKHRVLILFPFDRQTIGKPWAIVQYWGKESPMIQLYTRLSGDHGHDATQASVETAEEKLLARLGGIVDPTAARHHVCWPYFGHVAAPDMLDGFFERLEHQQGKDDTFYVGGATNFELVEPILQYSKYQVERHFG